MIKKALFALTVFALLLAACAPAAMSERQLEPSGASQPEMGAYSDETTKSYDTANITYSEGISPTTERMVVKDVYISLAVDDPEVSATRIQDLAEEMGGYVVSLQMDQTTLENGTKVPQGSIKVRIPAEKLAAALEKIKAETSQPVLSENITSQDVTAEYTDLGSKLRNLEAAEAQLQKIMDEATKTDDVLSVYSQLVYTREQIELIKGQMQYYEQAAALSSIQVQLYANEAVQPLSIGAWQPVGVAKDAIQTLINTVKGLANVAIWLVLYVLPTALLVLGPLALIVWGFMSIKNRRKKAKTAAITQDTSAK